MKRGKMLLISILFICSLMMCLSSQYVQAATESSSIYKSGYCGQTVSDRTSATNLTWKLEGSTLTISGKGDMMLVYKPEDVPWFEYKNDVEKVIIEDGVEMLSHWAFSDMENLKEVDLGKTVYRICYGCFMNNPSLAKIDIPASMMDIGSYAFYNCPSLKEINNFSPYLWIPENNVFETKAQGNLKFTAPDGMLQCFFDAMVSNNYN